MAEEDTDFAQELEQFLEEHDYDAPKVGDIRTGVIVSISQQGLIVDLGLKRDGMVPSSDLQKLGDEERAALKVNDEIPVYIQDVEEADSLIVSLFRARVQEDWEKAEALVASGDIIRVEIIGYNKGGLIAPFGRLRGFIPLSHVSGFGRNMNDRDRQRRMSKLRGEMLPVKVIEVDRNRRRLVFSEREGSKVVEAERRQELLDTLKPGSALKGRVRSLRDYGAFVDLGGVDGLVHVSELAWYRVKHPREVLKVGEEVDVYVLDVDPDAQRIRLSRKPFVKNPWESVLERYRDGQLVEGKIVRITNYGAFVELEPGIEGLLHTSQLARNTVEDAREIVKEGEVHLLRILSIDQDKERIRLSLKAVTPREQIEWMAQRTAAAQAKALQEQAQAATDEAEVDLEDEGEYEAEPELEDEGGYEAEPGLEDVGEAEALDAADTSLSDEGMDASESVDAEG